MSVGRNQTGIFYTSLRKEETEFPFSVPQNELDQHLLWITVLSFNKNASFILFCVILKDVLCCFGFFLRTFAVNFRCTNDNSEIC